MLVGPSSQQAAISILNDGGFTMAVCTGAPVALAVTWCEGRVGLHRFAMEVRSRQAAGQANGNAGLDITGRVFVLYLFLSSH